MPANKSEKLESMPFIIYEVATGLCNTMHGVRGSVGQRYECHAVHSQNGYTIWITDKLTQRSYSLPADLLWAFRSQARAELRRTQAKTARKITELLEEIGNELAALDPEEYHFDARPGPG